MGWAEAQGPPQPPMPWMTYKQIAGQSRPYCAQHNQVLSDDDAAVAHHHDHHKGLAFAEAQKEARHLEGPGAEALEIVRLVAERSPLHKCRAGFRCAYCGSDRTHHADGCLWERARTLCPPRPHERTPEPQTPCTGVLEWDAPRARMLWSCTRCDRTAQTLLYISQYHYAGLGRYQVPRER